MCVVDKVKWIKGEDAKQYLNDFLCAVDKDFIPALSERVNIAEYAEKLAQYGENLLYCEDNQIVAMVSAYMNREIAYLSSIAVKRGAQNKGIGGIVLKKTEEKAKTLGCRSLQLKTHSNNLKAISFYEKNGYKKLEKENEWILMGKEL